MAGAGAQEQVMAASAARVGLADEPRVISKALELDRLLATRLTAGGLFDTCRNVLCLDLAADALDVPVDKASIIKYSGLKKPAYQSSRAAAEGLLKMSSCTTVASVCIKLQCVSAQGLAEKLLTAYQTNQQINSNKPQYPCMAVFQACRLSKVKVSKSKILSLSGLKQTQWAKLEYEWAKFADGFLKGNKNETNSANLQEHCDDTETLAEASREDKEIINIEDFDIWKQRILREAYKELADLERKQTAAADLRKSPRKREERSEAVPMEEDKPRKSPRKSSAITPKLDRSKGVRVLF